MREAKLIITSENKAEAGIKSAVRDLLGIDEAAKKVGDTLKSAFTVIAIAEGIKKIAEFGNECVQTFGEVERTMMQLKASLGGNEASFERMTGLIGEMAGKTLSSKDEIEKLVAELGSLGKSDSEIDRITRASVALSNVTGKGLNEAFVAINATFSGTSGKLGKLVPELDGLTKAQLEAGGAVELLNQKLGAISDAMGEGISQKMHNLGVSVEEFKEAIGASLAPTFSPMISWITALINKWTDATTEANNYHEALSRVGTVSGILALQDQITIANHQLILNANDEEVARASATVRFQRMPGNYGKNDPQALGSFLQGDSQLQRLWGSDSALNTTIKELTNKLENLRSSAGPRITSSGGSSSPVISPIQSGDVNISWDQIALNANAMLDPAVLALKEFYGNPANFIGVTTAISTYDAGPAQEYANSQRYHAAQNESAGDYQGAMISDPVTELGKIFEGMRSGAAVGSSLGGGVVGGAIGGASGGLDAIGGIFSSLWKSVGPLITSFSSVQAILNPLQTIFSAMMAVVGPLVNQALAPLVGILKIVGNALGQILAPIIIGLGKVIDFIMQGILWVWNGIVDAVNWALGWAGVDLKHATLDDARAAGTDTSAAGSSGAGATYTGAQSYVFNFYNYSPVVGDSGLRQLAKILQDITSQNARYA